MASAYVAVPGAAQAGNGKWECSEATSSSFVSEVGRQRGIVEHKVLVSRLWATCLQFRPARVQAKAHTHSG